MSTIAVLAYSSHYWLRLFTMHCPFCCLPPGTIYLSFLSSTAPHNQRVRPAMDLAAIPSMPTNPNFTRNTPARSTYAYGTRTRPPATFSQQYIPTGGAGGAQVAPGGGFFKRLIPQRFSKRTRSVCYTTTT